MSDFDKLVEQQEAIRRKIEEASNDELVGIRKRLEVMGKATGRSIYDLLGLVEGKKATTSEDKPQTDKETEKRHRKWLKDNVGNTVTIDDKERTVESNTRYTSKVRDYLNSIGA